MLLKSSLAIFENINHDVEHSIWNVNLKIGYNVSIVLRNNIFKNLKSLSILFDLLQKMDLNYLLQYQPDNQLPSNTGPNLTGLEADLITSVEEICPEA